MEKRYGSVMESVYKRIRSLPAGIKLTFIGALWMSYGLLQLNNIHLHYKKLYEGMPQKVQTRYSVCEKEKVNYKSYGEFVKLVLNYQDVPYTRSLRNPTYTCELPDGRKVKISVNAYEAEGDEKIVKNVLEKELENVIKTIK